MKPETKELYKEIADYMEKLPITSWDYGNWFDDYKGHKNVQELYNHPCGAAGCLWGWAQVVLSIKNNFGQERFLGLNSLVERALELEGNHREYMFYGEFSHLGTSAPLSQVVAKLRRIAETGLIYDHDYDDGGKDYDVAYWNAESRKEGEARLNAKKAGLL